MNIELRPPQNLNEFFPWLKEESEKLWSTFKPHPSSTHIGMRWLPGLTDRQIADYEYQMGFAFPEVYKMYLRYMNGTEQYTYMVEETVTRGGSDPTDRYVIDRKVEEVGHLYHSYPRDLSDVEKTIDRQCKLHGVKRRDLTKKGIPHIMPISAPDRFLVMDRCEVNPIIRAFPSDRPQIAESLNKHLINTIFQKSLQKPVTTEAIDSIYSKVKFWLDDPVLNATWGYSEVRKIRLATLYGDRSVVYGRKHNRFPFKVRIARRLLEDGNKVRVSIVTDGRKIRQPEIGVEPLRHMLEALKDYATVEEQPRACEKEWTMLLAPLKSKGNNTGDH
jgi:hypothetical protein